MYENLLKFDRNWGETVLYTILLLSSLFLIYESYNYSHGARLVPLLTLIILATLIFVKLILQVDQKYSFGISNYFESNTAFSTPEEIVSNESVKKDDMSVTKSEIDPAREVRAITWTLIFAGIFFLFGIMNPIFALFFIFLLIEYDGSKIRSAIVAFLFFLMIYVLFIEFLNMRVYVGLLPAELF